MIGTRRYPVGQAIADAAQAVEDTAKIIAPVSAKGSPLSPPGTLKARTRVSEGRHHDPVTGYVLGLVGSPALDNNWSNGAITVAAARPARAAVRADSDDPRAPRRICG